MRRLALLALMLATFAVSAVTPVVPAASSQAGRGHPDPWRDVTIVQVNQCLSGLAGCFGRTAYPAVVDETIRHVEDADADVVVLNESCSADAARVAEATGLHLVFSTVRYNGAPLPCRNPEGRGVFGNAMLTADVPFATRDAAYTAQAGAEERRLACAVTEGLTVCGTHLSVRGSAEATAANDGQCAELGAVMASSARIQPTVVSGDVNRLPGCAAPGFWTATDAAATQAPGIQHVYGRDVRLRDVEVVPATYTDHDVVVVRFRLRG